MRSYTGHIIGQLAGAKVRRRVTPHLERLAQVRRVPKQAISFKKWMRLKMREPGFMRMIFPLSDMSGCNWAEMRLFMTKGVYPDGIKPEPYWRDLLNGTIQQMIVDKETRCASH